jgi:hypothetical protein
MVSKDKVWVDGDVLFADDLNHNIPQTLSLFNGSDFTTQSVTADSQGGETVGYTTVRTLDIDAAAIGSYIIIRGDLRADRESSSDSNPNPTHTAYLRVTIDGVQEFEITETTGLGDSVAASKTRDFAYKYIPTSDEKTNGFTVGLDLKVVRGISSGNGATVASRNTNWDIVGA